MLTGAVAVVAGIALLFWFVFGSGFTGRTRRRVLGGLAVLVAMFLVVFRYVGVSGDLVPEFRLRWATVDTIMTGAALESAELRRDFPQFLGPTRDGHIRDVRLEPDWKTHPPRLIWRRPVALAWSGFAIAGDTAVTQEQDGDEEQVVAYKLATGMKRWTVANTTRYVSTLAGDGPRATPTIDGGDVFAIGATGVLDAIDLATGRRRWSRPVFESPDANVPEWGESGSPLVIGDKIFVGGGGGENGVLVVVNRASGEILGRHGTDNPGYSSPFVATLDGVDQIVMFNGSSVTGHDVDTGRELWSAPWRARQPNVTQPLPVGDNRLLASAGYGAGSRLFEITRRPNDNGVDTFDIGVAWRSARLKSKFSNLILHEGHIYGFDDGRLACLEATSGRRRWKAGDYGHGQLLHVDDMLLISTETGDVVLVALDPNEHREIARHKIIDGKVWNPPALAGGLLLIRNDREAALFRLARRE